MIALGLGIAACGGGEEPGAPGLTSFYAAVAGIDGVYFYPPLGPEPTPSGTFDATLLDGMSVSLEAESAAGGVTTLGQFSSTTQPAVVLLRERERYWVSIPAASYLTDRAATYRIRVLLDGSEIGSSVLTARIFDVMAWNPSLSIGVHVRVEGSGAVRAVARVRQSGSHGTPLHCSDGVRNKDELGVDCGGSCSACEGCWLTVRYHTVANVPMGGFNPPATATLEINRVFNSPELRSTDVRSFPTWHIPGEEDEGWVVRDPVGLDMTACVRARISQFPGTSDYLRLAAAMDAGARFLPRQTAGYNGTSTGIRQNRNVFSITYMGMPYYQWTEFEDLVVLHNFTMY